MQFVCSHEVVQKCGNRVSTPIGHSTSQHFGPPVTSPSSKLDDAAQDRVRTGITGLDDILGGGLPANRLHLIDGEPGTGKTTLAIQFLMAGRAEGERCLYVTLSETAEELIGSSKSHGWSLDGIEIFELATNIGDEQGEAYTLFHPAEVELQETGSAVVAGGDRS